MQILPKLRYERGRGIDIEVDAEGQALVADKPKKFRKRKTADGSSCFGHPLKKLKEDHNTSGDGSANTTKRPATRSAVLDPVVLTTAVALTVSFYVSLYMDSETLHQTYVLKWDVLNESALDEPNVCRSLVDRLAPPMFFSQLRAMQYDQLFTEFNIGAARQTCLGAKVGMRLEHVLSGKKRLEGKCGMKANLLKEMDTEIAGLKAQLSLKEVETVEAICLRSRIADIKATDATLTGELKSLKERNVALESAAVAKDYEITKLTQDLSSLQLSCDDLSVKASTLECEKDKLVDQVYELEATCLGLCDEVMGCKLFKEQVEAVQNEQVKALSDCVAHIDSDLIGALGCAIDKGMQDGLKVGVDYGRAGRGLDVIAAYDPSAKANFVSAVDALRAPMVPIHRLKDQVVIGETSLSFALDIAHSHVQRFKGDDAACCLSLTDAMVLLLEALSVRSLTGKAITSMVPSMTVTNALSTTFVQANTIPIVPYTEVPPSPNIVFEEELDTMSKHASAP
nr:hypothetical protein [Tanacetum cinerariifolium]